MGAGHVARHYCIGTQRIVFPSSTRLDYNLDRCPTRRISFRRRLGGNHAPKSIPNVRSRLELQPGPLCKDP